MRKILLFFFLALIAGCSTHVEKQETNNPQVAFIIDVEDHSDDLFHITVTTENLSNKNNIYHFASTAPGTYQVLDFGRFVNNFEAFDKDGNALEVNKIGTNKWEITNSHLLSRIEYDIEDSFDAEVKENPISPMCGSGIEDDFIAINTFAVLGYFEGLQSNPIELALEYNSDWEIGTSLPVKSENIYYADTYDHLADSPILLGELSVAETYVNDVSVQVYVFSENPEVNADSVMAIAEDVLQSASNFIGYSPVPSYKFLMCLVSDKTFARNKLYGGGALEHSLSSLYVMSSAQNAIRSLQSTMAHEFLHILTPLFLHSEIIHTYNFEKPTPSQHVWLYEGVTEWASDIMQLRAGLIDTDRYMRLMSSKLRMNDNFDKELSLVDMALNSYDDSGYGSFINFYERGAVTASLLDIKLLELSDGKKGLREVFLLMLKKYGKNKPFSEENFFKELVSETYPEIEDYIDRYIIGSEMLPYEEYYAKIGYNYIPERPAEGGRPSFGTNISINENMDIVTMGVQDEAKKWGLEEGDVIVEVMGIEVTMESIRGIVTKAREMNVGDIYKMKVKRNNEIINIEGQMLQRMDRHVFVEMEQMTKEQQSLRNSWTRNLM